MDNVTGRDDWIIQQALMWAIAAIDRCSPDWRPYADRADMETLLLAGMGTTETHSTETCVSLLRRRPGR